MYSSVPQRSQTMPNINWSLVGGIVIAALILGFVLRSELASPAAHHAPPGQEISAAADAQAPATAPLSAGAAVTEVSLLDILGKLGIIVMLLYGAAWLFGRLRGGASVSQVITGRLSRAGELSVREMVPLGRSSGTLFLVETAGRKMLIGAGGDSMQLLWSSSSDETTGMLPVPAEPQGVEPRGMERPRLQEYTDERPLMQKTRHTANPQGGREADWERQRKRLISELMTSR